MANIIVEIVKYQMKPWIKTGFVMISCLITLAIIYLLILSGFNISHISSLEETVPVAISIGGLLFAMFILHALNLKIVRKVGTVSFQNDKLIINTHKNKAKFSYDDLQNIRITIIGYCGQQLTGGSPPMEGMAGGTTSDGHHQLQGYENKIKLKTKSGKKFNYNFYLGIKSEAEKTKFFLRDLSKNIDMKFKIIR